MLGCFWGSTAKAAALYAGQQQHSMQGSSSLNNNRDHNIQILIAMDSITIYYCDDALTLVLLTHIQTQSIIIIIIVRRMRMRGGQGGQGG
jgi:hypothetical protein